MKKRTPLKRSPKPLKRTRLKLVSDKRRKEMATYKALREDLLRERPMCDIWLTLAGHDKASIDNFQEIAVIALQQGMDVPPFYAGAKASELKAMGLPTYCPRSFDCHHRLKRGKHYIDKESFMAASRSCHQWVHDNPREARKLGLLA